ncbi:MAG TPA: ABC transporter substrate-binding protein [Gemmatimonadales bacterium]|nr:ABC transporter substrate-binding protein [Gemmatimonadales bacterium]
MTAVTRQRITFVAALATLSPAAQAGAQSARPATSVVIVTGEQATIPIPTFMEGAAATVGNFEVADQLYLRLAELGPTLLTAGDSGFVPGLAQSWTRRDSVTLVFNLHPRARWHDGVPVTARDVVFTFSRARDPAVSPRLANLLRHVASVTAESDHRVVFRFSRPYAEQMYDATFHVAPIPAHLLAPLPPGDVAHSEVVRRPVGSGPYRWVRSVPGQFVELAASPDFFLGKPKVARLILRLAADPAARLNLVLSGEADAMDNIPPPQDNHRRVAANPDLRMISVPSPTVGYLLFNQRDPRNRTRPHPILADVRVRRAITLGLDRRRLVQAVFGSYGVVPYGPVSQILWIRDHSPEPAPQDVAEARRLLAIAGWGDSDEDGMLDREGRPLRLQLILPNSSAIRRQMALLVQEQLRQLKIQLDVQLLEVPLWNERRAAGDFDVDFGAVIQDPSPSGITQSWSCTGGSNVAGYCNREVDSLMERAILAKGDPAEFWIAALRQMEADAPATFLYAPTYVFAVHRRFRNVTISPQSSWMLLRKWSTTPSAATLRNN